MFYGKIHYKWPFSIATLNYQRVSGNTIIIIWEQSLRASDTGTNLMPCGSEVEDHMLGTDFGTFLFGLSLGNWVECERLKQQWKKHCLPQASVEMSNIHGWLTISKHPLKNTNGHCLNSCFFTGKPTSLFTHPKSPNSPISLGRWVSGSLGVWFTVIRCHQFNNPIETQAARPQWLHSVLQRAADSLPKRHWRSNILATATKTKLGRWPGRGLWMNAIGKSW